MNQTEVNRFKKLYQRHLRLLKLQGKSQKTIDAYSRAVRRISEYFDCCPDKLTPEQLEIYFARLVESHSGDKGSSLRLTHEQSISSYFNISSDFLSLFLNFYAPLNLDKLATRVKRRLDPIPFLNSLKTILDTRI